MGRHPTKALEVFNRMLAECGTQHTETEHECIFQTGKRPKCQFRHRGTCFFFQRETPGPVNAPSV